LKIFFFVIEAKFCFKGAKYSLYQEKRE